MSTLLCASVPGLTGTAGTVSAFALSFADGRVGMSDLTGIGAARVGPEPGTGGAARVGRLVGIGGAAREGPFF